jgi:hypothetical protein
MHRYQFKRTIVLRQEIRQTVKVEADSETEARAIATQPDVEANDDEIEFETIEDIDDLELISTEEIEPYESA